MGSRLRLPERVAFDTQTLIYFLERHPRFLPRIEPYLKAVLLGETEGIGSVLILTEILTGLRKRRQRQTERQVITFFSKSGTIQLIDTTKTIADQAATLRAQYDLRTPDAIHLATAIESDARAFVTGDRKLARVKAIRVIVP